MKLLGGALAALGGTDPFGIAAAISALEAVAAGDLVALTSAHASVLDELDCLSNFRVRLCQFRSN